MEDMARLALVEQNVRDKDTYSRILYELLRLLNYILENPHDYDIRTIKCETMKGFLKYEALRDYLVSIGFQLKENEYTYPKENSLSKLQLAQAAIERKIIFCCGSKYNIEKTLKSNYKTKVKKVPLKPVNILTTHNTLLRHLQALFNNVLQYEDEELQELARQHIPLVRLQLMAVDDMREYQKKIKMGEIKGPDMSFDIALLKVLLSWFKHRFFTWVDAPACDRCGGNTKHEGSSTLDTGSERCNVEIYRCVECASRVDFPRYNDARALLTSRRGRCGEWANCFTLLCRSLGYDTRLVYSTSDHVWCEIWDYSTDQWLHADPCECLLDAPLTYSHGWGKRLAYVLACSRDDLQDVTWRYTTQHKEVLKRRTDVSEAELMSSILRLRAARQHALSDARRRYLARRNVRELAAMLTERKPGEAEKHGRVSGAEAWRRQRGETGAGGGAGAEPYVFCFDTPGECHVRYSAVTDRYEVEGGSTCTPAIASWAGGAHRAVDIRRKVEHDWQMAYLAREEGAPWGSISWCVQARGAGAVFTRLTVRAAAHTFHGAAVHWTLQLDDHQPTNFSLADGATEFSARFSRAVLTARLSGGRGRDAWQHAQLCRAPLAQTHPTLHIHATLQTDDSLQTDDRK